MVVYFDVGESPTKAIYFDNEGHVINYTIAYADKSITLTSNKVANTPVFRLTYTLLENDVVNTKFVITSYSIHYTKLYDRIYVAGIEADVHPVDHSRVRREERTVRHTLGTCIVPWGSTVWVRQCGGGEVST